jgi:hypothetical protein
MWCLTARFPYSVQLVAPVRAVGAVVVLEKGSGAGPAVYEGVSAMLARSGNAKVRHGARPLDSN